jgi:hypothetical protein
MQVRTNKLTEKAMTGDYLLAMFKPRLKDAQGRWPTCSSHQQIDAKNPKEPENTIRR